MSKYKAISEYYSDDKEKVSMVFKRGKEYRVVYLDRNSEIVREMYFTDLNEAEDYAEDWVYND